MTTRYVPDGGASTPVSKTRRVRRPDQNLLLSQQLFQTLSETRPPRLINFVGHDFEDVDGILFLLSVPFPQSLRWGPRGGGSPAGRRGRRRGERGGGPRGGG